jgi:cephalosporin hydroxylase
MPIANDPEHIAAMARDPEVARLRRELLTAIVRHRYSYNFAWYGRPIIQLPQDIVAIQELILEVKPDLIVETGIAHAGSLVLSASMLELLGGDGLVLGVDIDLREHARAALASHPLARRIRTIQGSSIAPEVVSQVMALAQGRQKRMVFLDSNHTHDHVLAELRAYAPLVGRGSYVVVFDTVIEDVDDGLYPDRPWSRGNNPKTAVWQYLRECDRFEIDRALEERLLITAAPDGYLRCVKD